jgi:death-on-curing protein
MIGQWRFISRKALELLHDESLAEHGGRPGLRDEGLLGSALARPRQLIANGDPDLAALAAGYALGLVRSHAFVDGNKRAVFLATGLFVALNGQRLVTSQAEATLTILALAAGDLSEDAFAQWLRERLQPRPT